MTQSDDMLNDDDYPAYTMGRAAESVGASQDFLRRLDETVHPVPVRRWASPLLALPAAPGGTSPGDGRSGHRPGSGLPDHHPRGPARRGPPAPPRPPVPAIGRRHLTHPRPARSFSITGRTVSSWSPQAASAASGHVAAPCPYRPVTTVLSGGRPWADHAGRRRSACWDPARHRAVGRFRCRHGWWSRPGRRCGPGSLGFAVNRVAQRVKLLAADLAR
jgi:hypothetical protein